MNSNTHAPRTNTSSRARLAGVRRLTALVLTLAVAATACTQSKLNRDDDVVLTGTVHGPDGNPLPNARVVLAKEVDFAEAVFGLTFLAASLGTICLSDQPPAICSKARRTTTDASGAYRFELKGRDTQGNVGTASTIHLSAAATDATATDGATDGAPSVSARFQVQRTSITVPTLRLWAPEVQVATGRTIRTTWTARETGATERVVFRDGSNTDSNVIWTAEGRSPLSLDGRLLEDSRGTATVESDATEEADGTRFQITHQSARATFSTNAVPPSRNAPCTPDPCPLTDGDLGPPSPAPPTRNEATVDLGRSTTPTFIVLRGCPGQCDVETSVDGLAYKVVGSGREPFLTITPVLGTPVRFVRLKSVSDLNQVAELSVWLANP